MSILQKILGRSNKAPVPVPTPEWPELDGQLSIRKLSPSERVEFYDAANTRKATKNAAFRVFLAVHCAVLPDGSRAFDDGEWTQLVDDAGSGSALGPPGRRRRRGQPDQRLGQGAAQKKIRGNPTLRKHLRIARNVGVSYGDLLSRSGAELPAWEASFEIDPPIEERTEKRPGRLPAPPGFRRDLPQRVRRHGETTGTAAVPGRHGEGRRRRSQPGGEPNLNTKARSPRRFEISDLSF